MTPAGSTLRLLVVDDNAADRMLLSRALKAEFDPVTVVEAGDEGSLEAALRAGAFDAVVTDYRLRWNDGLAVLRASHAAMPDVPVIMFTNTGNEEVAAAGLREGLADYIIKGPGQYARVAHSVRRSIAHAEAKRQEHALLAREQQARREAEEANRIKDEFLATVSHELRTPLNAIAGWLQILRAAPTDPAAHRRGIDAMERNSRLLLRIVEDLLDMSRIVTGKLTIAVRPTDFCQTVQAVVDALHAAAAGKRLSIRVTCAEPLDPVAADPDRLQQIVWNLLSNAVKFTPDEGIIDVALENAESRVRLRVRDTGKGISPDFLPRVFDRFTQQDSGTTRAHSGMGLGLAVVRHLVELHGGSVAAVSDGEGRGATFVVELPVAVAVPGSEVTELRRGSKRLIDRRVLAVDNDVDARDVIAGILSDAGAEVVTVESAAGALELLRASRYDVLISDIGMPGHDGYWLIEHVRAGDAAFAAIPAIALTAYGRDEDRLRALRAGFQLHLSKPVAAPELVGAVDVLAGSTHS